MGVDLPLTPPFSRRRWITDIKTPQYEKIQVGFPRPSFFNNKGEFFLSKKSVKASLFSTHYVSINHNLPRCHQGWSCFCGHDGFANPKCLHLSLHRPMNQNIRYLGFIMCCCFNVILFMCFCCQELCYVGKMIKGCHCC